MRLGEAQSYAKRYTAAATAYRRAVKLSPRDARAHARLGYVLAMQKKPELTQAMRSARKAVDLTPNDETYYYLAMVAYMSGEKDKAAGAITRAMKLGGPEKEYAELRERIRRQ